MRLTKKQLKRIIREEYSKLVNPNQVGDGFFAGMEKYGISQEQAQYDIAYQITGSDLGDQIADDYERETGKDPGYDGEIAVAALFSEMGFDNAVYHILDQDPSAEDRVVRMWDRDAGNRAGR